MSLIKTSLIIPTYNGATKILNSLRSIQKQDLMFAEVIVAIDGSPDKTGEVIQEAHIEIEGLRVIEQENKGRAAARNSGARVAEGDLLLFLDDDLRLEIDVVQKHLHHHQAHQNSILVGNLDEALHAAFEIAQTDVQKYKAQLSRKWMNELGTEKTQLKRPFITAAHFSIPKTLFESLGGFNDGLRDCEDYELALRAAKAGVPIYFDPTIIGWHYDFITARSYARRLEEYNKAYAKVVELHGLPRKEPHSWKSIAYFFFSFDSWLKAIDRNSLLWLPKGLRYKVYAVIFHSHTIFSK